MAVGAAVPELGQYTKHVKALVGSQIQHLCSLSLAAAPAGLGIDIAARTNTASIASAMAVRIWPSLASGWQMALPRQVSVWLEVFLRTVYGRGR
jgi:hypothetical protein